MWNNQPDRFGTEYQSLPRQREGHLVEEVEDGLVLHDPLDGAVHLLNLTASFIWECCDGTHSSRDIAHSVAEAASLSWQEVLKDVENTLSTFREERLLI